MKKVFAFMAIAAMLAIGYSCNPENQDQPEKPDQPEQPEQPEQPGEYVAKIEIDGNFADWAALPAGSFSKTYGDEEATHPALTHCKVYADAKFVYVYFEWDPDMTTPEAGVDHVPFHCYINTDGNIETGGYASEFADACSDILLEGFIYDVNDAEELVIGSYDPGAYAWTGTKEDGWAWEPDTANRVPDGGLCEGAGIEGKYEFKIDRAMMAEVVEYPIADTFSIGFDIQSAWESVGVLPNAAPSEDNPSGVVNSLTVVTQK